MYPANRGKARYSTFSCLSSETHRFQVMETVRKGESVSTILVIDDEDQMRGMLRDLLERAGHTVLDAQDGKAGQSILSGQTIDLVITDILMPERDGLEITRDVQRSSPGVKIIAISGGGRTGKLDFLEEAREFGAHAVLRKPFGRKDLLDLIESLQEGV